MTDTATCLYGVQGFCVNDTAMHLYGAQGLNIKLTDKVLTAVCCTHSSLLYQHSFSHSRAFRSSVRWISCSFKTQRHTAAKNGHKRQEQAASQPSSAQAFTCPQCSRVCTSTIRLYSQQQACPGDPQPSQSLDCEEPFDTSAHFLTAILCWVLHVCVCV